jgi:hypothetical protein
VFIIKLLLKDTKSDCRTFLYGYNVLLHDFLNRIPYHIVDLPQNGYNLKINPSREILNFILQEYKEKSWIYDCKIIQGEPAIISWIGESCNKDNDKNIKRLYPFCGRSTIWYGIRLRKIFHNFPTWILYRIAELPYLDCKLVLQAGLS